MAGKSKVPPKNSIGVRDIDNIPYNIDNTTTSPAHSIEKRDSHITTKYYDT